MFYLYNQLEWVPLPCLRVSRYHIKMATNKGHRPLSPIWCVSNDDITSSLMIPDMLHS